jgi:hypothetical protein
MLNNIIATFFVNELTASILPPDKKNVTIYRQQLDAYCTSVTSFMGQYNESYETVLNRLMQFTVKHKPMENKANIIRSICVSACPAQILAKFRAHEMDALFRRFIVEAVKKMTALVISISNEILQHVNTDTREKLLKYKNSIVPNFEDYLVDVSQNIYAEFSGGNLGEVRRVRTEQRIIDELQKQNEELHFKFLKIEEENRTLKQRIASLTIRDEEEESAEETTF